LQGAISGRDFDNALERLAADWDRSVCRFVGGDAPGEAAKMTMATAKAEIEAPIEKVWQIMLDLQRYGEWNPFIVKVDADGPVRVGGRFVLHVRWPGGGGVRSPEQVTRLDGPSAGRASWSYIADGFLRTIGAVRCTRVQSLESVGAKTRYSTREDFSGWLAFAVPLKKVQAGFEAHAAALKKRAESA
jgi:hypothetical protein